MAIDTAAKRKSVAHVARKWSGVGVTPDATPDSFWRQTVGRSYGGIAAAAPPAGSPTGGGRFGFICNVATLDNRN